MATYGRLLMYQPGDPPVMDYLTVAEKIPLVIGRSGVESLTAATVARVRENWKRNKPLYERIFDEIDGLAMAGVKAVETNDLETLGDLMNVNQGLLNALQVSSWEIEELVEIARRNGALGAKLTGGGGGGSMIALCPQDSGRVVKAMQEAGYQAMEVQIG